MLKRQKLLYILNVAPRVNNFSHASMLAAKELGIEFHIAGNWSYTTDEERRADEHKYGIRIHQIDFIRTPYHPGNQKAYVQLKALMRQFDFDAIHCNTPIGGVLGRLIGKQFKVSKVIYQAHGFHFFRGAPLKNWLIYYPVEWILAHYTDCLITINHEDYERTKHFRLKNGGSIEYVSGVGVAVGKFVSDTDTRTQARMELGLQDNETILLSVGEINQNKNHKTVIEALAQIGRKDIRYVICGVGPLLESHKLLVHELGLDDQVMFVGYRTDIEKFYQAADLFVIPSFREGLPVAPMEAMAAGLPCIASRIRGNVDLFAESQLMFDPHDVDSLCKALTKAMDKNITRQEVDRNKKTLQRFSTEEVVRAMKRIYGDVIQ